MRYAHKCVLAGAAGGAAGVITGSLLDVARVRLQQAGAPLRTLSANLAAIARREGATALFRGASYPLLTCALQNAVTFHAYGWALRALHDQQVRNARNASHAQVAWYTGFALCKCACAIRCRAR